MRKKIFISIASYCDPLLWWTVQSAWEAAKSPSDIYFGVVDQSSSRASDLLLSGWSKQLRYLHVEARDSRGACWARSIAFGLHTDEDYLLQIDSHTFFERSWDERLIEMLEEISIRSSNQKIIVSTRPFAFEFPMPNKISIKRHTLESIVLQPKANSTIDYENPIILFDGVPSGKEHPVIGYQLAAGFIFTRSSFIDEVPYDPHLYFHGEEQNLSIRAFSRGWDIWHPNAPPLYHKYKRHEDEKHVMHWDAVFEKVRDVRWTELQKASRRRMQRLLFDGADLGGFGLGAVRTLDEFCMLSGIDYLGRRISCGKSKA